MEETFDTYAYFWVTNFDCNPLEITKAIGFEPTQVLLKGESLKNGRSRQHSFWEFHSSLPRTEPFQDAHLSNLLENLLSKRQQIKEIASKHTVGINCVGYYTNVNPGFHMSAELINQCAMLGVSIDFDLYNCSVSQKNA